MSLADKLIAKRLEYVFEDESGYRFKVVCETGPDGFDRGWRATVTMTSAGLADPEAAVESLIDSARDFVRQAGAARSRSQGKE